MSTPLSEARPIRVTRRAPYGITEFGLVRLVGNAMMVDAHMSNLPNPSPSDLIVIGTDCFNIQCEPVRDF